MSLALPRAAEAQLPHFFLVWPSLSPPRRAFFPGTSLRPPPMSENASGPIASAALAPQRL
ncbi:uncharacterized protein STEHIDRAFT_124205 [Stereum hirsutum FP-91666 SS1]|uniref:uncharacterized protein n=1 Tax=Stereum hirsutum (strain FP-91666) TaxID=721885 RepID=UPI00044494BA|nr:uncharacterized protein STEHIDRAFT_124205 [Stereum hirsutum FP-91666 SS1]EIM82871.1 hypothetical protein STEHIDRAFT_124205 [Stereum hirsutum FP-91666 SS1]